MAEGIQSLAPTLVNLANTIVYSLLTGKASPCERPILRPHSWESNEMTENKTQKTQKIYTQQLFHKGLLETRPRSLSFSGGISSDKQLEIQDGNESIVHPTQPSQKLNNDSTTTLASQQDSEKQIDESSNQTWQRDKVPSNKRKRHDSPTENQTERTSTKRTNYTVPVHNKFDILSDEVPAIANEHKEYIPKPEPIFVTGIVDITPLRDLLNRIIDINKYTMTTLKSGHIIKLMPTDIETYKAIRDNLIENHINHYTYKLKSERAYRVVIRGLHASENTVMVKEELQANGHEVRQIVNVIHRVTKEKLPLYFIDLEPRANNRDIFNIKYINHVKVTIEAPYKKKEVLQCKRCQRFGHSKNQCFRPFRCVKCGNDHPTITCTKPPETEATCANCQGKHPASYKGCNKYKQYKEKILKIKPAPEKAKHTNVTTHLRSSTDESVKPTYLPRTSYADALLNKRGKPAAQPEVSSVETGQHDITRLLDTMFNRFQAIMKDMMDSMMDQMIKLITRLASPRD